MEGKTVEKRWGSPSEEQTTAGAHPLCEEFGRSSSGITGQAAVRANACEVQTVVMSQYISKEYPQMLIMNRAFWGVVQ